MERLLVLCINICLLGFAAGSSGCSASHGEYCFSKGHGGVMFVGTSEAERAAATGSIPHHGIPLFMNEDEWCPDIASRKYRSIDGSCNNVRNFGAAFKPLARLLPPQYDDGYDSPRQKASDGSPLPSARNVSLHVHPAGVSTTGFSTMTMQWGQWLDHDITSVPVASGEESTITCCGPMGSKPPFTTDSNCFPIELPESDGTFIGSCMEFSRSVPANTDKSKCLTREQVNMITSFIDGSQIYGSDDNRAASLRSPGFLLRTVKDIFLPESDLMDCIVEENSEDYCFFAGDERVNEHPGLSSMHTVWVREHNRIATELSHIRPHSSTQEIYLLTRKIVGALQQAITYNEWLPVILGEAAYTHNLVSLEGRGMYHPGVDPRIFNAFSAAAMRFGHSMIPSNFIIGDRKIPLRLLFERTHEVLQNMDDVVAGIVGVVPNAQNAEAIDRSFVEDITRFLFVPETGPAGLALDLVALNIQRGRDHGIPPYVDYRNYCGLRPVTGFSDTEALGPSVGELGKVYKSVDDIDLFTGLMHEPPITGEDSIGIGPTLTCLLALQFSNLKQGDRFFFDTDNEFVGFNDAQLSTIRKTRLAHVLCENTGIAELPRDVFRLTNGHTGTNDPVSCDTLRDEGLDLSAFA